MLHSLITFRVHIFKLRHYVFRSFNTLREEVEKIEDGE